MASPMGICLENVNTGEIRTFGSMIQASEFLGRSNQYIQARISKTAEPEYAIDKDGNKYKLSTYGTGKRKDARLEHKKQPKTKEPWKCEGYEVRNLMNHTTQLCTVCARAVGFCSWSRYLQPVDGWEAVPTKIRHMGRHENEKVTSIYETNSFRVVSCPLYIQDGNTSEERRKQRKMLMEEMERGE